MHSHFFLRIIFKEIGVTMVNKCPSIFPYLLVWSNPLLNKYYFIQLLDFYLMVFFWLYWYFQRKCKYKMIFYHYFIQKKLQKSLNLKGEVNKPGLDPNKVCLKLFQSQNIFLWNFIPNWYIILDLTKSAIFCTIIFLLSSSTFAVRERKKSNDKTLSKI